MAVVLAGFARGEDASPAMGLDPILDADPFTAEQLLAHPPAEAAPALLSYLRGVVAASRLDEIGAQRELAAAYEDSRAGADVARRALSVAGLAALRSGDYGKAADLFDREIALYGSTMDRGMRAGEQQNRDVAAALRDVPAQTIEGLAEATIPLTINQLGLTTAPTEIEGHLQVAVIDTGANLSALSTTAANALGVKLMTLKGSVRSATSHAVNSQIAVADTVRLGPATLHHVAFIVLDDAALSPLGPKMRIDAIIGFPVLAALGRISFHDSAAPGQEARRQLTLMPPSNMPVSGNLRFAGFDAYVKATAGLDTLPFVVDSGSDKSSFEKRYARQFPQRLRGLERRTVTVGGAGGAEERQVAIIPKLSLRVGETSVGLSNVQIHLNGNGSDTAFGTLGTDVLWDKGGYTIDFNTLDLTLGKGH
jgi:hypothetical protein